MREDSPPGGKQSLSVIDQMPRAVVSLRSVFYDLGFDEAQAHVLAMRADLIAALRENIKGRGWTQCKAAKELSITQPRLSALVKGARRDFSANTLLVLAARVGLRPTLKLTA